MISMVYRLKHGDHLAVLQNKYDTFHQPELVEIATKHDKSVGQVVLRWIMQSNIITAAKSVNPSRMAENIDIFNFELDDDDMKKLKHLIKMNQFLITWISVQLKECMVGCYRYS